MKTFKWTVPDLSQVDLNVKQKSIIKLFLNPFRLISLLLLILAMIVVTVLSHSPITGFLLLPFLFLPFVLTSILQLFLKKSFPLALSTLTTLIYFCWCLYVLNDVFFIHPDPQSPIALIFAAGYVLPYIMIAWLITIVFEFVLRNKESKKVKQPVTSGWL